MKAIGQAYMEYREACKKLDDEMSEYVSITWAASGVPVLMPKNELSLGARKELFRLAKGVERKLEILMLELSHV
jgi:hypothetical protein